MQISAEGLFFLPIYVIIELGGEMEELKKRKTPRYQSFNYNSVGAYFITICTQNRRPILSRIVGTGVLDCPRIELTKYGEIADKYIKQFNDFYDHLSVEGYVIMPNHIHLLLWVKEDINTTDYGQSRTPVPTNVERANSACSQFVSTFKRFCNKEYGENIWQARFNDHIVRNHGDYEEHLRYIYENPIRWYYDELYTEE
ncbi:MAG: transposase [Clostridia bacterium]|nr:transposase [Clostridia bacterium]